jgi:hypothetical protein
VLFFYFVPDTARVRAFNVRTKKYFNNLFLFFRFHIFLLIRGNELHQSESKIKRLILHTYIPLTLYPRRGSRGISDILRDTHVLPNLVSYEEHADMTGGKPIAVLSQSISGVSAINPLVAFYDIHGRKGRGALLLFCPGHNTRQYKCIN